MDKQTKQTKQVKPQIPVNSGMDDNNKKAVKVLNTQGEKSFLKHIFTEQETGRTMSYSEMRMRYG